MLANLGKLSVPRMTSLTADWQKYVFCPDFSTFLRSSLNFVRFNDVPVLSFHSFDYSQNILRGSSVLLGPSTTLLWRALAQSQNHIPGGGPAELTDLLEQYAQTLAQNMKLTYLNPVALVAPNLGEFTDSLWKKTKTNQQNSCTVRLINSSSSCSQFAAAFFPPS